jgi:hypothetical protein
MTDQPTNCITLNSPATEEILRPTSLSPEALEAWDAAEANIEASMQRIAALVAPARAALAQPEPVAPTDEEIMELMPQQMRDDLAAAARLIAGHDNSKAAGAMRVILNRHAVDHARAVLARWGTPPPQPVWADIHYAWELEDAEGEWQAGGSANSLEDVQREGNRYLQTYAQDGSHKLIIQRHCVSTIEEMTND